MAPSVRYITTFELIFHATPLATTHQAERQLGILYLSSFPLCPLLVILPHSFSSLLLLLFFGSVVGQVLCCHPSQELGGGVPGWPQVPPPCTPRAILSLIILSEIKCLSQSVVARGNIIPTICQQLLL